MIAMPVLTCVLALAFIVVLHLWADCKERLEQETTHHHLTWKVYQEKVSELAATKNWESHLTLDPHLKLIVNDRECPVYKAMGVVTTLTEVITGAKIVNTEVKMNDGSYEVVKDVTFPFEIHSTYGDKFKLPFTLR